VHLDHPARRIQPTLRTLDTAAQLGDLPIAPIRQLAPARPPQRLERARLALLPPLRQLVG
jgi:hypothetical protein